MTLPAAYLALVVAMALLGWLATISKTRAFWLFWKRPIRRVTGFMHQDAVERAWCRFERWKSVYDLMWNERPMYAGHWMIRSTSRFCRYYAGIPVFKNRVFTLL